MAWTQYQREDTAFECQEAIDLLEEVITAMASDPPSLSWALVKLKLDAAIDHVVAAVFQNGAASD